MEEGRLSADYTKDTHCQRQRQTEQSDTQKDKDRHKEERQFEGTQYVTNTVIFV